MIYFNKKHNLTVHIVSQLIPILAEKAIASYPNETGGLLVGRYNETLNELVIESTIQPTFIESTPTSYSRKVDGMEEVWKHLSELGQFYVGEWHSHPRGTTNYSDWDKDALLSIYRDKGVNIKKPVMVILSNDDCGLNDIGVYCFNDIDNTILSFEPMVDLKSLFSDLQAEMLESLKVNRAYITHKGSKGDATEARWIDFFQHYLPNRYKVDKAMVIDHTGNVSHQMDIVIYDALFTPFILNKDGFKYIPAEGVYAVFEVKQDINGYIDYAGEKIASVRSLKRTSTPMIASGIQKNPRPLSKIIGGILTTTCSYEKTETVKSNLKNQKGLKIIDIGCCLDHFAFHTIFDGNDYIKDASTEEFIKYYNSLNIEDIVFSKSDNTLFVFFLRLFNLLKEIGTVPAIDINAYLKEIGADDES